MIHGRNFDFFFPELFEQVSAEGHFYKNGNLLFKAPILAGMVGTHHLLKPLKFSLSINQRLQDNSFLQTFYYIFLRKTEPIPFLLLKSAEIFDSYEELRKWLEEEEIDSDVYFAVTGTERGEGAVITRGYRGEKDLVLLNDGKGNRGLLERKGKIFKK